MSTPYKLYNRIGSGGLAVEAALTLAETPFELIELDSAPGTALPDEFRDTNPWRQVPTLITPDGSTLTETAAILIHLAACFPTKGLAPAPDTPEHGQLLRWSVFTSVNVYESMLRWIYPLRFTTDPDGVDAVRTAAAARTAQALSLLEAAIGARPFMLGDAMSVLDLYVAMLFRWYKGELDAPGLAAMAERVEQHPVVAPVWQRHFASASSGGHKQ